MGYCGRRRRAYGGSVMSEIEWARAIALNTENYAASHPGHDTETQDATRRLAYVIATEDVVDMA